MRFAPALLAALMLTAAPASADPAPARPLPSYPHTRATDLIDSQFGEAVADPYRWLENDVRTDSEVAGWVAAENKATSAYLETLLGQHIATRQCFQIG